MLDADSRLAAWLSMPRHGEWMESDLMSDIGTGVTNVSIHLAHDANVFVAVEQ